MSLLLLALALSMDAFAAALSRGVTVKSGTTLRRALMVGVAFGAAQGLMPLLGWGLGQAFASAMREIDHWVAFALLVLIGVHMIRDGFSARRREGTEEGSEASLALLAIATSIDAAVAGLTLVSFEQSVAVACTVIGVTAFLLSVLGVVLGKAAGDAIGPRAQAGGGLVLIALGVKIVIEHLFFGG